VGILIGLIIVMCNHDNRFIFSPDWEKRFPDVSKRKLPKIVLDHFPMMLDCSVCVCVCWGGGGNRYFKFKIM